MSAYSEAGELFYKSVEDRRLIVSPFVGKRVDDGQRFRDEFLGFILTEFAFQCIPLIEFFECASGPRSKKSIYC